MALVLLPQCGGATPGAEPHSAADERKGSSTEHEAGSPSNQADGESADESAGNDEQSRGPDCDDGTCSKCGSGICPSGWYCDENASGGAACSWLAECAAHPSCGCVTRVLGASCKCREEAGGLKVACE